VRTSSHHSNIASRVDASSRMPGSSLGDPQVIDVHDVEASDLCAVYDG
jgi:hypothetical protein